MVCPNYHNLWHLKFAVVLIFFMCISFKHVWNFGKRMKRKCKLRYILSFFKHCWFKKYVFSQFLPVLGQLFFSRASPLWLLKVGRSAFPFVQKTGGLLLFIDKLLNRFYNILQYFNFAVELEKYMWWNFHVPPQGHQYLTGRAGSPMGGTNCFQVGG